MTIGTVVRGWREQKRLTQQQMEKLTGIEQRYLSALELDKVKNPGTFKLYKILKALDKTLDDLMGECSDDDEAARLQPAACAA